MTAMTDTATYSPEDNKLRLYDLTRLPADLYARVKAAGIFPVVSHGSYLINLASADAALRDVASLASHVEGIIVSNTTVARPPLASSHRAEAGGLSGRPLFDPSTRCLARLYGLTEGRVPLIGVGGISDAASAWRKIHAGASLLQVYTALVFRGPALVTEILDGLAQRLAAEGANSLLDCVGRDAAHQGLAGT